MISIAAIVLFTLLHLISPHLMPTSRWNRMASDQTSSELSSAAGSRKMVEPAQSRKMAETERSLSAGANRPHSGRTRNGPDASNNRLEQVLLTRVLPCPQCWRRRTTGMLGTQRRRRGTRIAACSGAEHPPGKREKSGLMVRASATGKPILGRKRGRRDSKPPTHRPEVTFQDAT